MRKHPSPWMPLLAGTLALLFAPDCTGETGTLEPTAEPPSDSTTTTPGDDAPPGVVLSAAIWTLAWDTDGVAFPDAGGLDLETDLGYHVHLQSGRILSHSVSFGSCDTSTASAAPGSAAPGSAAASASSGATGLLRWAFALGIRSAHAHTDAAEPSMIETSLIEDLTAPHETEASSAFAPLRHCRAHWLLARPMTPTSGPDDIPMAGRSIHATGTFERDGATHEFTIDTWWPHGRLLDLDALIATPAYDLARADGAPRHAFVRVTRHLGQLFDGIDFESASPDQIAGLAIDNLVDTADFHVDLWSPASPP